MDKEHLDSSRYRQDDGTISDDSQSEDVHELQNSDSLFEVNDLSSPFSTLTDPSELENQNSNDNYEDEDEECLEPFGYELLSQDDDVLSQTDELQDENHLTPENLQIYTSEEERIPDDDLTAINSIMKNIQIPDSAIPEWAKVIPEEAWLPVIINGNEIKKFSDS
ncbi:2279_t:CDS:2 [Acaulospora morrowiae]|uniref:2279_t:CDS:1 n=1 Tax=Acaulospora morrowiae TaxID=94023 RepID=A0A9N9CQJ8_9GLOM|nr:2279_t:CDS:2 [Acaulospora morrowiae]